MKITNKFFSLVLLSGMFVASFGFGCSAKKADVKDASADIKADISTADVAVEDVKADVEEAPDAPAEDAKADTK